MESKKLTLREIQLEELEILKELTNYIETKKLRYYLVGGTLLGAIRHNGFIPWDDDIDMAMPRRDYEILLEYLEKDNISSKYEILTMENGKHNRPFCKVINKNITIQTKSQEDKNLWIDIFPLDGLPSLDSEIKKTIRKILFYKGQIYLRTTSYKEILSENRSLFNRIIKVLLKPFTYRHKLIWYANKMDIISKKYDYENSEKVAELAWIDGYQPLDRAWFENSEKHIFENELFNIPVGWDGYLKVHYGNYMELPPEKERVDHKIVANKII